MQSANLFRRVAAYAALCVIWGSTWAAIRMVVDLVPPLRAAAIRFALTAIILGLVIVLGRMRLPRGRALRATVILSITMMAIPYALVFWAEQRVSSGITAVLFAAMPILTALLAPLFESREVPRRAFYAMIAGLGGIAIVTSGAFSTSLDQAAGAIAVLIAVSSNAASLIYAKKELSAVHPIVSTALQFALGALPLALLSLLSERHAHATWNADSIGAMLFLVVAGSGIAFPLYYWLVQQLEPYQVATMQWVQPLIAVAEGAFFLRERLDWTIIAGTAVVLASLVMVMRARPEEDERLTLG